MTQKIGIWGYGREGKALNAYFHGLSPVTILNDAPLSDDINHFSGDEAIRAISDGAFDIIYKSPGISLYRPEIRAAKEKGTQFSSATNLWFENNPKTKKIIVTGTKGKSTTASLLYHVMDRAGLSVSLAGNVGVPLLDLPAETDFTVIELSSYQLADLEHPPDLFVITNLFPEHLQWHQAHTNYYADKLRPISFDGDFAVIANAGNARLVDTLKGCQKPTLWYNDTAFTHVETQLKGAHNQENIQAVLTVSDWLGLNRSAVIEAMRDFAPLAHRMQEFQSSHGVLCVNDSISTTPETAMAALKVYAGQDIIVILGGTDRGQDYRDLTAMLTDNTQVKAVLLLPGNGQRIQEELNQSCFGGHVILFDTLKEAASWCRDNAQKTDVILLSPAAPSYDQFQNFEERGHKFIEYMQET